MPACVILTVLGIRTYDQTELPPFVSDANCNLQILHWKSEYILIKPLDIP